MSDIAARNGLMYGISFPPSGPSRLYSINEQTAAATPIGAAEDSSRVAAAPEPGTLGAMALGLALVAKLATKRRRQSL